MFRIGMDSFRVLARLCRLLKPSSSSRRNTRSSTSDWGMPKSSKVCGTPGLNPLWAGASVAAMKEIEPHSFYRPIRLNCLHARPIRLVNSLVRLCLATILLASAAAGVMAGAPPPVAAPTAEQLFRQAQKAEHDGEIIQAYLLYAEAAAADPTKIEYWSRAQALRPAASLLEASPPKPPDFP